MGKTGKSRLRRLAVAGGVVIGLLGVLWIAWDASTRRDLRQVRAELAQLADELGRPPETEAEPGPDERALEIDRLARELGWSCRVDPEATPAGEGNDHPLLERGLGSWLHELSHAQPLPRGTSPAPGSARAWIVEHESGIEALADAVLSGPAPRWYGRRRTVGEWGGPFPTGAGYQGQIFTVRILSAGAWHAHLEGRTGEAERRLRAAWQLRESIGAEPEVMAWLVANATVFDQLGLLRRLEEPPKEWRARLSEYTPLKTLPSWMAHDSTLDVETLYVEPPPEDRRTRVPWTGTFDWLAHSRLPRWTGLRRLAVPAFRAALVDKLRRERDLIRRGVEAWPCLPDLNALEAELAETHPRADRIDYRSDAHLFARAANSAFHRDLTLAVLDGRARGFVEGSEVVARCPEWRWRTHASPPGVVGLTHEGPAPSWSTTMLPIGYFATTSVR